MPEQSISIALVSLCGMYPILLTPRLVPQTIYFYVNFSQR